TLAGYAAIAPARELADEDHEQRRRVDRPVVDAPAAERERGGLAEAHLVEDATRFLLGRVVELRSLETRQRLQRPEREVRVDEHRHPRREQRVAAEQRHEPGSTG